VFDPGTGILDRFVNVSYSRMNRIVCTYNRWDNHFYIQSSGRKPLLPIPQRTEDNTKNVNVMCCLRCVEKRIENHHFTIYECRCNGRLQTKTRLVHTGLVVELEHLKIKTRLTNEQIASVKGEYLFIMNR
jgi:hypothetical protein